MINTSLGESETHICFYVFFSFGSIAKQTSWSSLLSHQKPTSPYRYNLWTLVFKQDSTLLMKTLDIKVFRGFQSIFFKKCVDRPLKQNCIRLANTDKYWWLSARTRECTASKVTMPREKIREVHCLSPKWHIIFSLTVHWPEISHLDPT